jgi:hypothetical protein
MTDNLGRCSEHLRKAVAYMAVSPGTPQEKLRGMVATTGYVNIAEGDFPSGPLRYDFEAIASHMSKYTEPQFDGIAAMCDERARSVIEQICALSDDVSRALGGQK